MADFETLDDWTEDQQEQATGVLIVDRIMLLGRIFIICAPYSRNTNVCHFDQIAVTFINELIK